MNFTKTIIETMKHWVNGRLTNYVEIVKGKGLSTEDYTSEEKEKLSTVQAGAEKNAQPDWNETDETQDSFILNKPNIPDTSGVATEEYVNSPKSQLILIDQETGENYIICIKNGNLVTYKAE